MNQKRNTSFYREYADKYDQQVKEYDSYAHDIIFGMSYEFVRPEQKLLDIGIGTGLASEPFAKIGLHIYGLDASEEMLKACKSKAFTRELHHYDMAEEPIPYSDGSFDHVICCGATHFIGALDQLFAEIKRVIRPNGIFAFTFAPSTGSDDYGKEDTAWGVPIFKHSAAYISRLLAENGFTRQKEQRVLTKGTDKTTHNMLFSVIIAQQK